jgi:hypothetical protein
MPTRVVDRVRPVAPVRHLQRLYSVVLGVAVGLAVDHVIDTSRKGVPVRWSDFALFFTFAVVALAFYQISARYLDLSYEGLEPSPAARRRVVRDLVLGGVQVLLVVALGVLVGRPTTFAYVMLILFGVNLIGIVVLKLLGDELGPVEQHAVVPDVFAVSALAAILLVNAVGISSNELDATILKIALPIIGVVRMAWHYAAAFDDLFFFRNEARPARA